jgi:hypothetical protein
VSWSAPTDNGGAVITGYKIYRGTTSGGEIYLATVSTLHYKDTAVVDGRTYYYKVCAVNANGDGDFSTELSSITFVNPPSTIAGFTPSLLTALSLLGSIGVAVYIRNPNQKSKMAMKLSH